MQYLYQSKLSDRERSAVVDRVPRHEPTSLAIALIRARDRLGLTQDQLADVSGVSRPTIANIERSDTENVKLETLKRLAKALGVPVSDLTDQSSGESEVDELIDRFLASDYGRDARPTAEEIAWLRALPSITWLGREPTEKTIDRLLDALRSSRKT